ncbi:hypothetical protein HDU99_009509, partial [Rhizoclosmatium hyalinum]
PSASALTPPPKKKSRKSGNAAFEEAQAQIKAKEAAAAGLPLPEPPTPKPKRVFAAGKKPGRVAKAKPAAPPKPTFDSSTFVKMTQAYSQKMGRPWPSAMEYLLSFPEYRSNEQKAKASAQIREWWKHIDETFVDNVHPDAVNIWGVQFFNFLTFFFRGHPKFDVLFRKLVAMYKEVSGNVGVRGQEDLKGRMLFQNLLSDLAGLCIPNTR